VQHRGIGVRACVRDKKEAAQRKGDGERQRKMHACTHAVVSVGAHGTRTRTRVALLFRRRSAAR
jgi:ethanolamine ammonia-lyase small subunit